MRVLFTGGVGFATPFQTMYSINVYLLNVAKGLVGHEKCILISWAFVPDAAKLLWGYVFNTDSGRLTIGFNGCITQ